MTCSRTIPPAGSRFHSAVENWTKFCLCQRFATFLAPGTDSRPRGVRNLRENGHKDHGNPGILLVCGNIPCARRIIIPRFQTPFGNAIRETQGKELPSLCRSAANRYRFNDASSRNDIVKQRMVLACSLILAIAMMALATARLTSGLAQGRKDAFEGPNRRADATTKRQLQGTASCAASVCHGGNELGQPRSEFTTWNALDPHVRAYQSLLSESGQEIAKHLNLKTAHEEPLCLKCHVDPGYENARPNFRKEDGVGCESCHGAALAWLTPHYRRNTPWEEKQTLGMTETKDLAVRVEVCARCHVGTPDCAVDHDLIAAGHPALRFEFATYFANLPPHWNVEKDKKTKRGQQANVIDFELCAWAIGQLITSANALELLSHRADPNSQKPWPEFAELDCFACHHDLQAKTWRQQAEHIGKRRPGTLTWNPWYRALLPDALALLKAPEPQKALHAPRGHARCPFKASERACGGPSQDRGEAGPTR